MATVLDEPRARLIGRLLAGGVSGADAMRIVARAEEVKDLVRAHGLHRCYAAQMVAALAQDYTRRREAN